MNDRYYKYNLVPQDRYGSRDNNCQENKFLKNDVRKIVNIFFA